MIHEIKIGKRKKTTERTSSTKTLPGRGGKASNPDALLRTRICLPFLGLCTKLLPKHQDKANEKLGQYERRREALTGNRRWGHGARGDEDDEEGAEGKGEGAVAGRKLHDSIGRGKKRGREG